MRKKLLLLVAWAWFALGTTATGQSFNIDTSSFTIIACGSSISVDLSLNNPGLVDSIEISGQLPTGLGVSSLSTSNGSVSHAMSNDSLTILVQNLSASALTLSADFAAGCAAIGDAGGSRQLLLNAGFVDNGTTTNFMDSATVTLNGPELADAGYEDQDEVQAGFKTHRFQRVANVSDNAFNGQISMRLNAGPELIIEHLTSINPELSNIAVDYDSTGATLTADVTNLAPMDTLEFVDTAFVTGCSPANLKTFYTFQYGCSTGPLCETVPIENSTQDAVASKPTLVYFGLEDSSLCFLQGDTIEYTLGITNTSDFSALNLELIFNVAPSNSNIYMLVPEPSVEATLNGSHVLSPDSSRLNAIPDHCRFGALDYRSFILEEFHPEDTILLRFTMTQCCGTFDQRFVFPRISAQSSNPCGTLFSYNAASRNIQYDNSQFFENYITNMQPYDTNAVAPAMLLSDTESFAITNVNNNFWFSNGFYPDSMLAEGRAVIEVELQLDSGLRYVEQSLEMRANLDSPIGFTWQPFEVVKKYGAPDPIRGGFKDTLIARFALPSSFYFLNTIKDQLFMDSLNLYLSNSSIHFRLLAICPAKTPVSEIRHTLSLIPDTLCASDCRLQLNEVSDQIAVLCPGCVTPGYITRAFQFNRISTGRADADNNHWPDDTAYIAADLAQINRQRAIIGDTLEYSLWSYLWPGQDVTLPTLGFGLNNTVVRLDMPPVLTVVSDIEVTLADTGGGVFSFTYPLSAVEYQGNEVFINLHLDSLIAWNLLADTTYRVYGSRDTVYISGKAVVAQNFTSPEVVVQEAFAQVYATGVWHDETTQDAGDAFQVGAPLSTSMRYWCEGWGAKFAQLRVEMPSLNSLARNTLGSINPHRFECEIELWVNGNGTVSPFVGYEAADDFPFEFRELFSIDSIVLAKPPGFRLEDVTIVTDNPVYDSLNLIYTNSSTPLLSSNTPINGNYVFYPGDFIQDTTAYPDVSQGLVNHLPYVFNHDEDHWRFRVELDLIPEKCNEVANTRVPLQYSIHYGSFPGQPPGFVHPEIDTILFPQMVLRQQQLSPDTTLFSGQSFALEMKVENNALDQPLFNSTTHYSMLNMPNTFVRIAPSSPALIIDTVIHPTNSGIVFPYDAQRDLYELGTVKENKEIPFRILGRFLCPLDPDTAIIDSILVITGYNCQEYPDSLVNACYLDTTVSYIVPTNVDMEGELSVDSVVTACDTLAYTMTINAKGVGTLFDMEASVELPAGSSLTYVPGSAVISDQNNQSFAYDSPTLTWSLDTLGSYQQDGYALSDGPLSLEFAMAPECGALSRNLSVAVSALTFCSEPIQFTLEALPDSVTGGPDANDAITMASTFSAAQACDSSITLSISYTNPGNQAWGEGNFLRITAPPGMDSISGPGLLNSNPPTWTFALPDSLAAGDSNQLVLSVTRDIAACWNGMFGITAFEHTAFVCDPAFCAVPVAMDSISDSLNVPPINAVFSAPDSICVQDTLNLSAATGSCITHFWDFGDGYTSTANAPVHTFDTLPGNYTIRHIVQSCQTDTSEKVITVYSCCDGVLTCPNDTTVACDSLSPTVTGTAVAIESGLPLPVIYTDSMVPGNCPNNYVILRTWSAHGACGPLPACTQTITVIDTTPPVFAYPPMDVYYYCNTPYLSKWSTWLANTGGLWLDEGGVAGLANDGCGPVTWSYTLPPGVTTPQLGTVTVTFTVTDSCGNSADTVARFTLLDSIAPVISNCPDDFSVCGGKQPVFWTPPTALDACDTFMVTASHAPGDEFHVGTTVVSYTFMDSSYNESKCQFSVTVSPDLNNEAIVTSGSANQNPDKFCHGETIGLSAGATYNYQWSTGATTDTIQVNTPGTYAVTITDQFNCMGVDSITLGADTITAFIVSDHLRGAFVCTDDSSTLAAFDSNAAPIFNVFDYAYLWSNSPTDTLHKLKTNVPGPHYVIMTHYLGCSDTSAVATMTGITCGSRNGSGRRKTGEQEVILPITSSNLPASVRVFPNPFDAATNIHVKPKAGGRVSVQIRALNGQLVTQLGQQALKAGQTARFRWQPNQHTTGIYLAEIATPDGIHYVKLIRTR